MKVPDVVVSCSFTILIISYYYYYYCGKTLRFARTRNERPGKPRCNDDGDGDGDEEEDDDDDGDDDEYYYH